MRAQGEDLRKCLRRLEADGAAAMALPATAARGSLRGRPGRPSPSPPIRPRLSPSRARDGIEPAAVDLVGGPPVAGEDPCTAAATAGEATAGALSLGTLLLHLGCGHSLRETVVRARQAHLADLSDVALLKRLKKIQGLVQHGD